MFFDGADFSAKRKNAFQFKGAREAIQLIHDRSWFQTQIVLAYDSIAEDLYVSAHTFSVPDEVIAAAAKWKAISLASRGRGRRGRSVRGS